MEYKELNRPFLRKNLWTGGYFVAISENVIDEVVPEYYLELGSGSGEGRRF